MFDRAFAKSNTVRRVLSNKRSVTLVDTFHTQARYMKLRQKCARAQTHTHTHTLTLARVNCERQATKMPSARAPLSASDAEATKTNRTSSLGWQSTLDSTYLQETQSYTPNTNCGTTVRARRDICAKGVITKNWTQRKATKKHNFVETCRIRDRAPSLLNSEKMGMNGYKQMGQEAGVKI